MRTISIKHGTNMKHLKNNAKAYPPLPPYQHTIYLLKKAIPLQAWTDPEGSRRLKHPDFKTTGTWW
jgi:hypothetical protein